MDERFIWKAEIEFEGTAEEFNQLTESLGALPVAIQIPEWVRLPRHLAGCMPVALDVLLGDKILKELADGMPRLKMSFITDIPGGIRTPHFHWEGDVVLLDRERFKTLVAQVAHELAAGRVEAMADYIEVMDPVGRLSATPIHLP
jgi:hypothetical protein